MEKLLIVALLTAALTTVGVSINKTKEEITELSNLNQTYTNDQYGFSFSYPSNWSVSEDLESQTKKVEVSSPTGFTIAGSFGPKTLSGDCEQNSETGMGQDNVQVMQNDFNIFLKGDKKDNTVSSAYILKSDTPCDNLPFMVVPKTGNFNGGIAEVEIYAKNRDAEKPNDFLGTDYKTAKAIISSFKFNYVKGAN